MEKLLKRLAKYLVGFHAPHHAEGQVVPSADAVPHLPGSHFESSLYTEIKSSGYFDYEWYYHVYSNEIEYPQDLLLDYVRSGIINGRDPSPYFNTVLYRREQNVQPEHALVQFLRSKSPTASGAYRDEQALLSAQQSFRNKTETRLIEDRRADSRPFAVYVQYGAGALFEGWRQDKDQPWHLLINHYDTTYAGKIPCDVEFQQVGELPGTKFTSIHSILEDFPHILAPYDYVLLLDDDILFEKGDITRLFTIVQQHGWDMAQASLSSDSHCSYQVFYNSGKGGWRLVNGVEIMMPIFSRSILNVVRELIGQSISGWGFDSALSMVAKKEGFSAAVVDDITACHTRPINADTGKYYQMLHKAGIYPEIEFTHLQKKFRYTKPLFYEIPPVRESM